MSISLGAIGVELGCNSASFVSGMTKAQSSLKSSMKSMSESLEGFGNAASSLLSQVGGQIGGELSGMFNEVGQAIGAMSSKIGAASGAMGIATAAATGLAAAGIAVVGALSEMALSGGELAESLSLMSQRTGISIRNLQTLQAAGASVGVPLEDLSAGFRTFSEALSGVGKGGAAQQAILKELGVTSHDTFTALSQLADAFSKMQDGPVKAAMAAELFGKSSAAWIPILDRGRDGLSEFSDMVDKLGPQINGEAVQSMEAWKKSTTELSLAWDSFKQSLSGGVSILAKIVDYTARATKAFADMAKTVVQHPLLGSLAASTGGVGLLALHQFSKAGADSVSSSSQSLSQQAAIAAEDALIARKQKLFEIEKAGSLAQYNLEQQELAIQGAVANNDYAQAASLQAQIPALKAAVEAEKQRAAQAKAALEAHQKLLELIAKQGAGQIHVSNPARNFQAIAAPDLTQTTQQFEQVGESLQKLSNIGGVTDAVLRQGKDAIADFYKEFDHDNRETIDVINQRFTDQLNNFKGLLALQAISQQQFNDVSKALETERVAEIQKIQVKSGTDFATSFASAFADIADQADKFAKNLSDAIGGAVNDLSGQLASLATSGRANFKQVGQSLESNVFKAGSSALIGSATKHVAGAFGIEFGKPDGTASRPLYVKNADGLTDHVKNLGQKMSLGNVGSDIGVAFKNIGSSLGSIFGKLGGGGFGSLFGSLFGGLFGGFRADGGSVAPGVSYIVGEKGRERFVPATAGTIIPNGSSSGSGSNSRAIQVNAHFHGVTDADTFKASKSQILGHLATAVGRAVSRR